MKWYCQSPFSYARRPSRVVMVGQVAVGSDHPLRVQSMCTTDTMDTAATVAQTLRLVKVGCEIVRVTAPTLKHAANLANIRTALLEQGCEVPLVADIHFTPEAAMEAALHVEKVRVNPGNFADTKHFAVRDYSDAQYADELARIEERFIPLVSRLKEKKVALRVGTNHGSLSDRIMNRFGDSAVGMVESALEFVRICQKLDYHAIILSMKSSQPKVMVQAYRMLAQRMEAEGMDYPFHVGVTEAGDGEDGRIKSAVGIGALLEDGIGDTLRVSLTEEPEAEIPVAFSLAKRYSSVKKSGFDLEEEKALALSRGWKKAHPSLEFLRLDSGECKFDNFNLHSGSLIRVISPVAHRSVEWEKNIKALRASHQKAGDSPARIEFSLLSILDEADLEGANQYAALAKKINVPCIARFKLEPGLEWAARFKGAVVCFQLQGPLDTAKLENFKQCAKALKDAGLALMLELTQDRAQKIFKTLEQIIPAAEKEGPKDLLLCLNGSEVSDLIHLHRALAAWQQSRSLRHPVVLAYSSQESAEALQLSAAILMGSLLCEGIGDALLLESTCENFDSVSCSFNVLQGAGVRASKTEFIACPSCGRTLFDLQEVTRRIRERTGHLVGVKIAIMGCIVNGPGEMADADFGYVGGAPDKINLYVGKQCVEKGIAFARADDRLIELIKEQGRWKDPLLKTPL